MGWRAQEAYDRAERERQKALRAALPRRDKMRLHGQQLLRAGILVAIAIVTVIALLRS
jgi:hypothetical protein